MRDATPDARLDAALLAAHEAGDGARLIGLYAQAAERADAPARPFFLTQAWVHALEAGDRRAEALAAKLRAMGRL